MNVVTREQADEYLSKLIGDQMPSGGTPAETIADVSWRMAQYTGRADWGPSEQRTEYVDGGTRIIECKVWPITTVSSINDDTDHVWDADTAIDSTKWWISHEGDGVVYFEYFRTVSGDQNIRIVYTGGYASAEAILAADPMITQAALKQIYLEILKTQPGTYPSIPGSGATVDTNELDGYGLSGEVRALLTPYVRRRQFA